MNKHLPTILVGIVALVLGYFAGREHVKYEIRSSFADAASAVLGSGNPLLPFVAASEDELGEVVEGEMAAETNGVRIEVTDARVDHPKVKKTFGRDFEPTEEPHLVLTLAITNQDQRRILRFSDNPMAPGTSLRDDVDNVLAPSLLDFMSDLEGALPRIQPSSVPDIETSRTFR